MAKLRYASCFLLLIYTASCTLVQAQSNESSTTSSSAFPNGYSLNCRFPSTPKSTYKFNISTQAQRERFKRELHENVGDNISEDAIEEVIWSADFDGDTDHIRSRPFKIRGPDWEYSVCWQSGVPVIVREYSKIAEKGTWQRTTLTHPGGDRSGEKYYPGSTYLQVMFDLQVPPLPAEGQEYGSIVFRRTRGEA